MGCATSRSPARVGVIVEDEASLYQAELFPHLADSSCWVGESSRDHASSSFTSPPSPPPCYTPLPLSGHVTLMLGQESKSQESLSPNSTSATATACELAGLQEGEGVRPSSVLETSAERERRESVASHHSRVAMEIVMRQSSLTEVVHSQPLDIPVSTRSTATLAMCDSLPDDTLPLQSLRLTALSSSLPAAVPRPPSPFPRSRSLSFQLPPLRTISEPDDHTPSLSPEPHQPHRLPPLRELGTANHHHHHRHHRHHHRRERGGKKRGRVRSHSCQLHTNSLTEPTTTTATVPIIQ